MRTGVHWGWQVGRLNPLDARVALVVVAQTPEGNASRPAGKMKEEALQLMFHEESARKHDVIYLESILLRCQVCSVNSVVVKGTEL